MTLPDTSSEERGIEHTTPIAVSAERRTAAVWTVADRATDADDLAVLLAMLGLHPSEGRSP